ncbi:MAG TPA: aminopeptidase [Clostridiales bacterium]|nr:aminopeptidase [Clostridiales bacterium]
MDPLKSGVEQVLYKCMGIKEGEELLIITDDKTSQLGDLFYDVALSEGLQVESLQYPALSMDGQEPPTDVADALLNSDVAILITSTSLTHTRARKAASDKGVRIASLPGFTEEMLKAPMMVDYDAMTALSQKIAALLTRAQEARITTKAGTDLTLSLVGRTGEDDCGVYNTPGAFGNLPAGEAYIAPTEGTAKGTIVYDASMGGVGLLKEPIRVTVENGYAVNIEGGEDAETLKAILAKAGKNSGNIAELGIGTNAGARVTGSVLEDEKVLGTVHIALGDNANFGGKVAADCHLDGILLAPDLYLDAEMVMKGGRWLV